jgi:hypothetical protein
MMSLLYRKGAIALEECPAKAFETETPYRRCPESVVQAMLAIHFCQNKIISFRDQGGKNTQLSLPDLL